MEAQSLASQDGERNVTGTQKRTHENRCLAEKGDDMREALDANTGSPVSCSEVCL
jgi:hypothetical protein